MAPPGSGRWIRNTRGGQGRSGTFRGRGGASTRGRKPCRYFAQTGSCRYGDNCPYSHDQSPASDSEAMSNQSRDIPESTLAQEAAKTEYNSWKRLIKTDPFPSDTTTIELVWSGALNILNGDDRDLRQRLPQDLDDDALYGREHVLSLLGMVAHANGSSTFISLSRPFIQVITHPALVDCLSVDTFVGNLYNFISGSNGTRAIPFFQRLIETLLEQYTASGMADPDKSNDNILIGLSIAIRELLRRERRAMFHDDLAGLIESVDNSVAILGFSPRSMTSQIVGNILTEVRGMVARARGMIQEREEPQADGVSTTAVVSTYPRQLNEPRDRHDNDKKNISRIQIIPTEEEIRSDHPPFLPSTDLDQPHFLEDQVERHLDTHFRLLRHDIFGDLCDALGGAMVALEQNPTLVEDSSFNLGNIRAHCNPRARVSYLAFDRRRGLEPQISFLHPPPLRRKTASERRKWWEESKRMDEGTLLCLLYVVSARCSLLFFTVSEKITDPSKDHGLTSDTRQATITAKLSSTNQRDLEMLTNLSCQSTLGLLIEFPGVLLDTFVPVLENLQSMQRENRLPFRQWILPERSRDQQLQHLEIPPPLYARGAGFAYILDPILKDANQEFSIDVGITADDQATVDELETMTSLDRGQCQALITALTREFAFIQGPPGTGKSFLGVQLMRVLMACKTKADIGPVVVV